MERISEEILSKLAKLSFQAMGQSSPNPPVAAVVLNSQGKAIAEAGTQATGKNHAEREAYSLLKDSSVVHDLYVTLEPCTHFGKTPPCRDLILQKKPRKVFLGWQDPNPLVDSQNEIPYKEKNIQLQWNPDLKKVSEPFLKGFRSRVIEKKPWIWFKSAVTEGGFYAPLSKQTTPISSSASQFYAQILRAKWDAVIVGPGTIQKDTPSLHFRLLSDLPKEMPIAQDPNSSWLDPFLSCLFGETLHEQLSDLETRTKEFQPQRLFFLAPDQELSSAFLEKQKNLNTRFGKKGCQFFQLLSQKGVLSNFKEIEKKTSELSDYPLVAFTKEQGRDFVTLLAERGINTLLCEVGSFLFSFLEPVLSNEDIFLTIRSPKKWESGLRSPGEGRGERIARFQIGEDQWEFHNFLAKRR